MSALPNPDLPYCDAERARISGKTKFRRRACAGDNAQRIGHLLQSELMHARSDKYGVDPAAIRQQMQIGIIRQR